MKENEKEVIDTPVEETQEEVNEVEETNDVEDSNAPTLEDYETLKKKAETLEAQKEHWRKKAEAEKQKPLIKTNETESNDEERLLRLAKIANQVDDEDLEVLKTINGSSLEEKLKNPAFVAFKAQKDKKKRSEASALKPSGSNVVFGDKNLNKPGITPEEHKKLWEQSR